MANSKQDELHFLEQILRNLKHLEHIYTVGKTKDEKKLWYTQVSISNTEDCITKLKTEIEISQTGAA
jgi:hypothetical protein